MDKLFVLTRKDLSKSQQAVQAGHALAEYLIQHGADTTWNNGTLIYLSVKDKSELKSWKDRLKVNDIKFSVFIEPDINNEPTSIACVSSDCNMFSELRLL